MRKKFCLMLLTLFIGTSFSLVAQNAFTVRYFGLTVHPFGDQTASIQPYKLDKQARFVANFGGFASFDHYVYKDLLCVTAMQGLFTDCAGGLGGFTHIGIRALVYERKKHRFMLGLGPMIYYREDWNRFEEYDDKGSFNRYHSRNFGDIQWRIFPIAGEFAWHWQVSDHLDVNTGFTPGLPLAMSLSVGVTWWPKRIEKQESEIKIYVPKKDGRREKQAPRN